MEKKIELLPVKSGFFFYVCRYKNEKELNCNPKTKFITVCNTAFGSLEKCAAEMVRIIRRDPGKYTMHQPKNQTNQ